MYGTLIWPTTNDTLKQIVTAHLCNEMCKGKIEQVPDVSFQNFIRFFSRFSSVSLAITSRNIVEPNDFVIINKNCN